MELADVLKIALAIIGMLVMAFCAATWREIAKLRQTAHSHSNRITELRMAVSIVCRKVGINPVTYEDEE